MIKVITFDLWRTLFRPNAHYKEARVSMLHQQLAPSVDLGRFATMLNQTEKETDAYCSQTGQNVDFVGRVHRIWDALPQNTRKQFPFEELYDRLWLEHSILLTKFPPTLLEPDVAKPLKYFWSLGLRLGIISNTGMISGVQIRRFMTELGIMSYFEPELLVFSDEVKSSKPKDKIFQALVQSAAVAPREVLHVGDDFNADYQGALQAGFQSRFLSPDSAISTGLSSIHELMTEFS